MRRGVSRSSFAIALLLGLLSSVPPLRGVVFCVGADGHLALESSGASPECSGCGEADEVAPSDRPAISASGDCGCIDFEISANPDAPRRATEPGGRIGQPPPCATLAILPPAAPFERFTSPRGIRQPQSAFPALARPTRTIVLRV